jgi:hypothetical protein
LQLAPALQDRGGHGTGLALAAWEILIMMNVPASAPIAARRMPFAMRWMVICTCDGEKGLVLHRTVFLARRWAEMTIQLGIN